MRVLQGCCFENNSFPCSSVRGALLFKDLILFNILYYSPKYIHANPILSFKVNSGIKNTLEQLPKRINNQQFTITRD
jgi:hypothetical protein